ncbi:MAG: hypothetical protein AB1611_09210 [bacterium]
MSQAVMSVQEHMQEEDTIFAKMFEEILKEKLDVIFKIGYDPSAFDLEDMESGFHE